MWLRRCARVGSTLEDVGFDVQTTESATCLLKDFAQKMHVDCTEEHLVKSWAGLRPKSTQVNTPRIGPVENISGLWGNTGHFRNGIVHSPGASELLVQRINQEDASLLKSFGMNNSKLSDPLFYKKPVHKYKNEKSVEPLNV